MVSHNINYAFEIADNLQKIKIAVRRKNANEPRATRSGRKAVRDERKLKSEKNL